MPASPRHGLKNKGYPFVAFMTETFLREGAS